MGLTKGFLPLVLIFSHVFIHESQKSKTVNLMNDVPKNTEKLEKSDK